MHQYLECHGPHLGALLGTSGGSGRDLDRTLTTTITTTGVIVTVGIETATTETVTTTTTIGVHESVAIGTSQRRKRARRHPSPAIAAMAIDGIVTAGTATTRRTTTTLGRHPHRAQIGARGEGAVIATGMVDAMRKRVLGMLARQSECMVTGWWHRHCNGGHSFTLGAHGAVAGARQ